MAKFRNESSTSVSTFVVALGVEVFGISTVRGVLAETGLPVGVSLATSFLISRDFVSPGAVTTALFSTNLVAVVFWLCGLASERAI